MKEIELHIPETINDISLRDYVKFMKVYEANETVENNFLDIKVLEIFCGMEYKDIVKVPIHYFNEALEKFYQVFQSKTPLERRFSMTGSDGVEIDFGFIPNLDKISLGEYIDLTSYADNLDTIHKAMAVLYRPVHKSFKGKEAYRIAEYSGTEEYADVMLDMPLGVALGAKVFFYRLGTRLLAAMKSYIEKKFLQEATLSEEQRKALAKDMDGFNKFMPLLTEKLLTWNEQQSFLFTQR